MASPKPPAPDGSPRARENSPATPQVVFAGEVLPAGFVASVYLAGGSGTGERVWHDELALQLAQVGFDGVVYVAEPRPGGGPVEPERLHAWGAEALACSDLVVFALGDGHGLLGLEQSTLWGQWLRTGRLIGYLGPLVLDDGPADATVACSDAAEGRMRLRDGLRHSVLSNRVPVAESVSEVAALIFKFLRPGAFRRGGERSVPLSLWRSPSFQSWYRALLRAGHVLEEVDLEWTHRSRGVGRPPFLWAMRPRVRVRGERRQLSGEVVIGRADVSVTVLYHRKPDTPPLDTQVVLVREFRAAVRNRAGFAWMLPGGSAAHAGERRSDPRHTAAQEVFEETGLRVAPEQLQAISGGDRQLVASLTCHHAQLFRVALSDEQLAHLRATAATGRALGATPSERCFVHVRRLADVIAEPDFDWSHLGMLMFGLADVLYPTDGAGVSPSPMAERKPR